MKHRILAILVLVLFGAHASFAQAAEPRLVGTFGDWDAYIFMEGDNKVCYMAARPKKSEGNYKTRGEIYALITHRPAEKTKDVFSYITGYAYKPGSEATVKIDGNSFALFTQDDTAWTPDAETDSKMVAAIRDGSNMVVSGTSSRGTTTTDTFGLRGSSSAYSRISEECGY
jgi:hypothetical protein